MILVAAALACVLCVVLTGGRLERLAALPVRWAVAALGALGLQVVIVTLVPSGSMTVHQLLHGVSYLLAGAFIVVNRRIPGLAVLALGAGLNSLAIAANHGTMPASPQAMRLAGLVPTADFANSAPLAHPRLLALGDVIPVPGPWPLGNVISIGDLLIVAGLYVVLRRACREPAAAAGDATGPAVATPASASCS